MIESHASGFAWSEERASPYMSRIRALCAGGGAVRLALSAITLWSSLTIAIVPSDTKAAQINQEPNKNPPKAERVNTKLDTERPIARSLAPRETHTYEVSLPAGQYLHVAVDPQELELTVNIAAPDGSAVLKKISVYGPQSPIEASLVSRTEGTYTVAVSATENNGHAGRYQLTVKAIRVATARDELLSRADQAIAEAQQLQVKAEAESKRAAVGRCEQALPLLQSTSDQLGEAQVLELLASLDNDLGDNQSAVRLLKQSFALFRAFGDRRGEGMALSDLGSVENDLGKNEQALTDLNQALSIRKEVGDKRAQAETLEYIGDVYESTSKTEEALKTYNAALELRRKIGDLRGEAESLKDIGVVYFDIDEEPTALEYYTKALSLQKALHDLWSEALTLNSIGAVYGSLGEKKKALEYFEQSLPLKAAVGNRRGEAHTLGNMCSTERTLGEWQSAMGHCHAALTISREIGDREEEAADLTQLGLLFLSLGEPRRALKQFRMSLVLARATSWPLWEATNLNAIGQVFHELKDDDHALANYDLALAIRRKVRDRTGEAATLCNIGLAYEAQEKTSSALDQFKRALAVSRAIASQPWEASSLYNIAWLYTRTKENEKALNTFNQALPIDRKVGDERAEASVLYGRARAERNLGSLSTALADIESALNLIEVLRTKVISQQLRSSYFSSVREYYDFYIDLLMQLKKLHPRDGYDVKALAANERSRARSLLESLGETQAEIRSGVDGELLQREQSLQQLLDGKIERRMRLLAQPHGEKQAAATQAEVERLLGEYEVVEAEIREKSPRYAALTQVQPFTVEQIQSDVVDPNTLLLEYALGEQRSYVWAVTPSSFNAYKLPSRGVIENAAKRVYRLAGIRTEHRSSENSGNEAQYSEAVATLSRMLLTPVAPLLKGKRLLIVSDGALQYIPFGILVEPHNDSQGHRGELEQMPLIVEHEITYLPSASTLSALRLEVKDRTVAPKTVAVLADPVFDKDDPRVGRSSKTEPGHDQVSERSDDTSEPSPESLANARRTRSASAVGLMQGSRFPRLVFSRREADSVIRDVPAEQRMEALDFDASWSTATSEQLFQYRIVHFATHSLLDSQHPELSSLVLSLVDNNGRPQNGYLQLRNIYNLKLSADLVVLSGCETALGQEVKGEGLLGLTRGFMYAGTSRVVASLWQVDDAATAELMGRFYRAMLTEHLAPAAALRQAQNQIRKEKRWTSPYYWGAFVLQGDWQ